MDDSLLKKTIWDLCNDLVTNARANRSRDSGMRITHQDEIEDIGVSLTRWAEIGAVNRERIYLSHRDWQAVVQRTWPDWDAKDSAARMVGQVSIELAGDKDGPGEALMWIRLRH